MDESPRITLDDMQQWIGREHQFAGIDEVSRNDIRRKLEIYCFACPLHDDAAAAKAHGYRDLVAPVSMTPLWSMPAYWSPGEPVGFAPELIEKPGGRADRSAQPLRQGGQCRERMGV